MHPARTANDIRSNNDEDTQEERVAWETSRHEEIFRGTNHCGDVVDLVQGTVLGVYDNEELAQAARDGIREDIRSHTNFRIAFDSRGRVYGRNCVRCECVLGTRRRKTRSKPASAKDKRLPQIISSFTGSKTGKRQRRPDVRGNLTCCKAELMLAMADGAPGRPRERQWVVYHVMAEHNHPHVPAKETLTPEQEAECRRILGAKPSTESKRNCLNHLADLRFTGWKTMQHMTDLAQALRKGGNAAAPATPVDFKVEGGNEPMLLSALCGEVDLAFVATIAVYDKGAYEAHMNLPAAERKNIPIPSSSHYFTICRHHGSSQPYLIRGTQFESHVGGENVKFPLPPCPPRVTELTMEHAVHNATCARRYSGDLHQFLCKFVPSVESDDAEIFLESAMWQTHAQQTEFNKFPEALFIDCTAKSNCSGYQLVLPTSFGVRGTFRVGAAIIRSESSSAIRFVHRSLVWLSQSNTANSGAAVTRVWSSDGSPVILRVHEHLAEELHGADDDCAVVSCVFHRHVLKFWKILSGCTAELTARLDVVKSWIARLVELELEDQFEHEWQELRKYCSAEFAEWPSKLKVLLKFLDTEHQDRRFWAWAFQPRHMALFIKAYSPAEGQHKVIKYGKLQACSTLYDLFRVNGSANRHRVLTQQCQLQREKMTCTPQEIDRSLPQAKRLIYKVMCSSHCTVANFRKRFLNEVDFAGQYETQWLGTNVCELTRKQNPERANEDTHDADFSKRPWLKHPCAARLPRRVYVQPSAGAFGAAALGAH